MAAAIISRKDARAQGLKRYFTGEPCKSGHVSERAVSNGNCLECFRAKQAERYQSDPATYRARTRQYYALNRDEIRSRRNAEYAGDIDAGRARAKAYRQGLDPSVRRERRRSQYAAGRDHAIEYSKRYRQEFPAKTKAASRVYNQSDRGKEFRRKWKEDNRTFLNERERARRATDPERRRESHRKWSAKDEAKAVIAANAHRRRARILASPGAHSHRDLQEILKAQGHRCAYCRLDLKKAKKHVDHIVALAAGGSNSRSNLQYLCAPCNQTKSARDPIVFARSIGLLL